MAIELFLNKPNLLVDDDVRGTVDAIMSSFSSMLESALIKCVFTLIAREII